jgi:predicted dehydrogenase
VAVLLEHLDRELITPRGFALVGAGLFGERHAQAYQRHHAVDFASVCDLNGERAQHIAKTYGARSWTTNLQDVLADPAVHAVSIATPDAAHRDVAIAAAKAGKHLLIEKPLATTIADAEAIVSAADTAGVTLMVDFHNRLNPPMVAARQAIQRGEIGTPAYVYARLSNTIAVPQDMLSWAGRSSAMWFLGSHMVDIVGWMLDDNPVHIYAAKHEGILKAKGIDCPDLHVATMRFAKGTLVVLEHAWILPRSHSTVKDLKVEILGSEGALYIDGSHNRTFEQYTASKGTFPDMMVPPFGPRLTGFVLDAVAHFVDAVTDSKPVLATGQEGVANTRIVSAIIEAAERGVAMDYRPT